MVSISQTRPEAILAIREVLIKKTVANAIRFTVAPRFLDPAMVLFELARSMLVTHDGFHLIGVFRGRMGTVPVCGTRGA